MPKKKTSAKRPSARRRISSTRKAQAAKTSARPAAKSKRARTRRRAPQTDSKALRDHVLYVLRGGGAHLDFETAVANLPAKLRGAKPSGLAFTPWRLLEHMRIAQWDILEFSRNPNHVSPEWPGGYWPETDSPPNDASWNSSIKAFRTNLKAMQGLIANPKSDLFARIPHGNGQTLLREALLVADHNAYHLGQLVMLRRLLGAWTDSSTPLPS